MSPRVHSYSPQHFEIPEEGLVDAEVFEVQDLGEVQGYDGELKNKVKLIWRLDTCNSRGYPFEIHQTLNASLHPKSALYRVIQSITGEAPPFGQDYELNSLTGVRVRVLVKHNHSETSQKTYANVADILRPASPSEAAEAARVAQMTSRVKAAAERPRSARVTVAAPPAPPADPAEITDQDIPF